MFVEKCSFVGSVVAMIFELNIAYRVHPTRVIDVYLEAPCCWVHRSHVLAIADVLHGKLVRCIPERRIKVMRYILERYRFNLESLVTCCGERQGAR